MSNLLVNTRDQQFVLFEQLGIEKLFESEAFKDFTKDDLLMIMNEAEKLAVNVLAPVAEEPRQALIAECSDSTGIYSASRSPLATRSAMCSTMCV